MATLALIFAVMGIVGWIWIVVSCFRNGETLWGIGSIVLPVIAPIYAGMNFRDAKIPLFLMVIGIVGRIITSGMTSTSVV